MDKSLSSIISNSKRIMFLTTSGYGNIGQEMLIDGFKEKWSKELSGKDIMANSINPVSSSSLHSGIRFFHNLSFGFLSNLLFADLVIYLGDELSSSKLDRYYAHSFFQGKFRIFMSFLSVLLGKKLVFYSVGAYSFQKKYPFAILRFCARKSEYFSVRDEYSLRILQKMKIIQKKMKIDDDPAYFLSEEIFGIKHTDYNINKNNRYDLNRKKNSVSKNKNNIVISISSSTTKSETKKIFLHLKKSLSKYDHIYFLIFSSHPKLLEESDIEISKELIRFLHLQKDRYSIICPKKYRDIVSGLEEIGLVYTNRYHCGVFFSCASIPIKIFNTDAKMNHFPKANLIRI